MSSTSLHRPLLLFKVVVPRDVPLLRKIPVGDRRATSPRVTSVHLIHRCFPGCVFERL